LRPPGRRVEINRRIAVALSLSAIATLAGSIAIFISTKELQTAWSLGQILIGIGTLCYTITGIATVSILLTAGTIPVALARRSWLGVPRVIWAISVAGLLLAAGNLAAGFISPTPSH
jgi:hypothetical protein